MFRTAYQQGSCCQWYPILGYDIKDRKLIVNEKEAALVRRVFDRFLVQRSVTRLCKELNEEGHRTKRVPCVTGRVVGDRPFDKGTLYKMLHNRIYVGEAVHNGTAYPGQHAAIISRSVWDRVTAVLSTNAKVRSNCTRSETPALLKGLIYGPSGRAMTPTHTRKGGKQYRYYTCAEVLKHGAEAATVRHVPAGVIENAVMEQARALLRAPEIVVETWRQARAKEPDLTEREVRNALHRLEPLWNELFPAEQARIIQLLVERIDIGQGCAKIRLRVDGLASVAQDLMAGQDHADGPPLSHRSAS